MLHRYSSIFFPARNASRNHVYGTATTTTVESDSSYTDTKKKQKQGIAIRQHQQQQVADARKNGTKLSMSGKDGAGVEQIVADGGTVILRFEHAASLLAEEDPVRIVQQTASKNTTPELVHARTPRVLLSSAVYADVAFPFDDVIAFNRPSQCLDCPSRCTRTYPRLATLPSARTRIPTTLSCSSSLARNVGRRASQKSRCSGKL